MEFKFRLLEPAEEPPIDLLLLADPSEKLVRDYLSRGSCYIASSSNEIIGVFVLLKTRPETIEIVNIAVREDYQGKGIGRKLIEFAKEQAKRDKAKTIEIGTGNSSIGQLYLYQKCGFRITGIDRDFFVRHYDEAIYENGIQCRDMIRLSLDL
ncbi:GNAT family N-acetyltransferase [Paenibacillus sp. M1]|uniref:GNAT family N-acetyltransferase n=1 Tax=Paenibacillus haidiansis TaxID=1574488 RepID=A0ABU7VNM5_9BACL